MENYLQEIGLAFPPFDVSVRIGGRLFLALILGALIGWERERRGRAAGLRTHMLVTLGAALFTIVAMETVAELEVTGKATASDRALVLSQIIRGIAAGVGFLGAGAILKRSDSDDVQGLTTAATIWLTAAAGMAVGAGWFWPAAVGIGLAWFVLLLSLPDGRNKDNTDDASAESTG